MREVWCGFVCFQDFCFVGQLCVSVIFSLVVLGNLVLLVLLVVLWRVVFLF